MKSSKDRAAHGHEISAKNVHGSPTCVAAVAENYPCGTWMLDGEMRTDSVFSTALTAERCSSAGSIPDEEGSEGLVLMAVSRAEAKVKLSSGAILHPLAAAAESVPRHVHVSHEIINEITAVEPHVCLLERIIAWAACRPRARWLALAVVASALAFALGADSSRKLLHGYRMQEDFGAQAIENILRRTETWSHYAWPMTAPRCPVDIENFESLMRPVDHLYESIIFGPML
jgi:hypothetical protein